MLLSPPSVTGSLEGQSWIRLARTAMLHTVGAQYMLLSPDAAEGRQHWPGLTGSRRRCTPGAALNSSWQLFPQTPGPALIDCQAPGDCVPEVSSWPLASTSVGGEQASGMETWLRDDCQAALPPHSP